MPLFLEAKREPKPQDAYLWAEALHMELLLNQAAHISMLFSDFRQALISKVLDAADSEGKVEPHKLLVVQQFVEIEWRALNVEYQRAMFERMRETIKLVQDAHLILHDYYFNKIFASELTESLADQYPHLAQYPHVEFAFAKQQQEVIDAAAKRVYGDGLKLSDRLWNLDNKSYKKLQDRIVQAIGSKEGAVSLAKDLEQYLYTDARWTRWTTTRLYKLDSVDKLTSEKGLIRKPARIDPGAVPPTKGIAYNALRLARSEIQATHDIAYQGSIEHQPWVEGSKWNLSAQHPRFDICNDYAEGGPNGDGIYPKGGYPVRPHPNCFCYPTARQMDKDQFIWNVRGWLRGTNDFLDDYGKWLGFNPMELGPAAKWAQQFRSLGAASREESPKQIVFRPLKTVGEAEEWARKNYPDITWSLKKGHIDTINLTLKQFNKLAHQYPWAAEQIKAVKVKLPHFRNATGSWSSETGELILNKDAYSKPEAFKKILDHGAKVGHSPKGCNDYEYILSHEFGHAAGDALRPTESYYNFLGEDPGNLSRYAHVSEDEAWAEGFASLCHTPKAQRAPYVNKLEKVLELAIEELKQL